MCWWCQLACQVFVVSLRLVAMRITVLYQMTVVSAATNDSLARICKRSQMFKHEVIFITKRRWNLHFWGKIEDCCSWLKRDLKFRYRLHVTLTVFIILHQVSSSSRIKHQKQSFFQIKSYSLGSTWTWKFSLQWKTLCELFWKQI